MNPAFADFLAAEMKRQHVTLYQVADAALTRPWVVSAWLSGTQGPYVYECDRLAEWLEVRRSDVRELAGYEVEERKR